MCSLQAKLQRTQQNRRTIAIKKKESGTQKNFPLAKEVKSVCKSGNQFWKPFLCFIYYRKIPKSFEKFQRVLEISNLLEKVNVRFYVLFYVLFTIEKFQRVLDFLYALWKVSIFSLGSVNLELRTSKEQKMLL